jgi:ribosomal protein S18 acetylase RimI-like enzyme
MPDLPNNLTIRIATAADKDRVTTQQVDSQNEELSLHASRATGESIKGLAWELIHQRGGFVIIAEDNGTLIGHVGGAIVGDASLFLKPDWHQYGLIFDLYIKPEYRRQHLGSALVEAVMHALRNKGVKRFRIVGLAQNEAALRLYRKTGFTDYEMTLEYNP